MRAQDFFDIMTFLNIVMIVVMAVKIYETTVENPALYIWTYMEKRWLLLGTLCAMQFGGSLALARICGQEQTELYFGLAAVYATGIWWFFRSNFSRSATNLMREITEFLPGSCPVCTLYRAGVFYKFRKHGDPVPEHPECEEQSG